MFLDASLVSILLNFVLVCVVAVLGLCLAVLVVLCCLWCHREIRLPQVVSNCVVFHLFMGCLKTVCGCFTFFVVTGLLKVVSGCLRLLKVLMIHVRLLCCIVLVMLDQPNSSGCIRPRWFVILFQNFW